MPITAGKLIKSVWTGFICLVPYVTLWGDFSEVSRYVPPCPQSARTHGGHSVQHCTHSSVCCAMICDVCKNSPTWVKIVHKTRNSSVYCTKTNKKKVSKMSSFLLYLKIHSMTSLQPFTLMQSWQVNRNVCCESHS